MLTRQTMPTIDHNNPELSIYKMVRNRLPFILDNANNQAVISGFTLELMHQLNTLFNLPAEEVGKEQYYSVIMQSILADIIAVYILTAQSSVAMDDLGAGEATGGQTGTFLKRAKAGSAEVEYEQEDVNKTVVKAGGGGAAGTLQLIAQYKASAISKAYNEGWRLVIFEEDIETTLMLDAPFYVIEQE